MVRGSVGQQVALLVSVGHTDTPMGSSVQFGMAFSQMWVRSLGQEDPLEKKIATHSSILSWEIPWIEEPGGLVHGITKSQT